MATWNYSATSSFIGGVDLRADGTIITLDDTSTAVKVKNFTVKGLKTPTDDETDTDDYGKLGNALSAIFNIGFSTIKARTDVEFEF